jgi:phage gp37-like protein
MLAECEDGLVALVKNAALGQKLATVAALPEIDGDNLVKRFGAEAPAVYVAPGQIALRDGELYLNYGIGCVARSSRGQEAARKGDGKAIGLYQIVEGVAAIADRAVAGNVNWSVVGIDYLADAQLAQNGLQVAVVRVRSSGWIALPPALDEAALAAFKTFRADYDVEPHESSAEHAKWAGDPPNHDTTAPEVSETTTLQQ